MSGWDRSRGRPDAWGRKEERKLPTPWARPPPSFPAGEFSSIARLPGVFLGRGDFGEETLYGQEEGCSRPCQPKPIASSPPGTRGTGRARPPWSGRAVKASPRFPESRPFSLFLPGSPAARSSPAPPALQVSAAQPGRGGQPPPPRPGPAPAGRLTPRRPAPSGSQAYTPLPLRPGQPR